MRGLNAVLFIVCCFLRMTIAFAEPAQRVSGQFNYGAGKVALSPIYAHARKGDVKATMGFEIENVTERPVRLALMLAPSLQLDDGTTLRLRRGVASVTGLSYCMRRTLADCQRGADSFIVLRPKQRVRANLEFEAYTGHRPLGRVTSARLGGQLFVLDLGDGNAWIESVSLEDIPVIQAVP
jgi:hypothetical protein